MTKTVITSLIALSALALAGCQQQAATEAPPVEDVGEDDGSSQDLPELEAAEAAKNNPPESGDSQEPTADGSPQEAPSAAAVR